MAGGRPFCRKPGLNTQTATQEAGSDWSYSGPCSSLCGPPHTGGGEGGERGERGREGEEDRGREGGRGKIMYGA